MYDVIAEANRTPQIYPEPEEAPMKMRYTNDKITKSEDFKSANQIARESVNEYKRLTRNVTKASTDENKAAYNRL